MNQERAQLQWDKARIESQIQIEQLRREVGQANNLLAAAQQEKLGAQEKAAALESECTALQDALKKELDSTDVKQQQLSQLAQEKAGLLRQLEEQQ